MIMGIKIDSNRDRTLYALLMVVRPRCSTVVFSGIINVTVTKKLMHAVLLVCMSVRGGRCLSCRSLFVIGFVVIYCCCRLLHV